VETVARCNPGRRTNELKQQGEAALPLVRNGLLEGHPRFWYKQQATTGTPGYDGRGALGYLRPRPTESKVMNVVTFARSGE